MTEQQYSSKDTSRNQLPALIKKLPLRPGYGVFDIGCGKYNKTSEFLEDNGATHFKYDEYHMSINENLRTLVKILDHGGMAEISVMANLLNVIKEEKVRMRMIRLAKAWSHVLYIACYEGDKSGVGAETRDGWQNNRRTKDYVQEVQGIYSDVEYKNGMIIAIRRD